MSDDNTETSAQAATRLCKGCKKDVKSPICCYKCLGYFHPSCAQATKVTKANGRPAARCKFCTAQAAATYSTPAAPFSVDTAGTVTPLPEVGTPASLLVPPTGSPSLETLLAAIEASSKQSLAINAKLDKLVTLPDKVGELSTKVKGLEENSHSRARESAELLAKIDGLTLLPAKLESLTSKFDQLSISTTEMFSSLTAKVEDLTNKNALLSTRIDNLEDTSKSQAAEITRLVTSNTELKLCNTNLTDRLASLERNSLNSDLIISAVPELEGEDLLATFGALTTQLSVDVPLTDVLEIGRIKSTLDSNKPRLILCKLRSVQCRNRLLAAKRAKGPIYANQLGLPHDQPRTPIFINEHLPPTLSKFLGKVRAYAKERGYRFIWTRNGLVYVKRDASSDHILIKSEADLQLLSHRT
ncbi:uncharacterized protein LOC124294173 [Neodiprion lecontei]|uniref:Uncharacterized protein LOC124294173 n=1 Tax=Neodiprion lecontei TaxID=441921 RepID=A0ABM3G2A6_NEOLC|nr:uncharacterized protein LOC124294173 [Neodiprion lecontei]